MLAVINRHCLFSDISAGKENPSWFNREKIFLNLTRKINRDDVKFYVFFDGEDLSGHFLDKYKDQHTIIIQKCGSGAASFVAALDFASTLDCESLYFVEDDYIHKKNWINVLKEGLSLGADYVTLYDHPDKYDVSMYNQSSMLLLSPSSHWKITPSTTDTFACKKEVLLRDMDILKKYSTGTRISRDHERFLHLGSLGRKLISSIPGFSNHTVVGYESPTINWQDVLENE